MKRLITLVLFSLLGLSVSVTAESALPKIVPAPVKLEARKGDPFKLSSQTRIFYATRKADRAIEQSLKPFAEVFASEIQHLTGFKPAVLPLEKKPASGDIVLKFDSIKEEFAPNEAEEDQSYQVKVYSKGIIVTSQYTKGVSYATASLIQSITESSEGYTIPCMNIEDSPAASYRGVMIDVARKVHHIDVIKDVVRLARHFKVRYVHLHLTDHQHFTFPFAPITDNIKDNHSYTLEELNDLVSYADARGVTLVPEFDLPGHSARVKESGYLDPGESDADVASPANYDKIIRVVDEMLKVFKTSPYFHIGGDESAAGHTLVPFLEAINKHLRGEPAGGKRRMLLWEGFHGAPVDQLPAKGEDRVIVLSWESSYNAPWDLLKAGYEIINSSWAPTYILANFGGPFNLGIPTGKSWTPRTLYSWDKNTFMHWEAGRPVFADAGPKDPDLTDHRWNSDLIGKSDQVIGGQMQFWEQKEVAVIDSLTSRLPAMSERLWNPEAEGGFEGYQDRIASALERVLPIVQPVSILPARPDNYVFSPIYDIFQPYSTKEVDISLVNRSKIPAEVRYELIDGMYGGYDSFGFHLPNPVTGESPAFKKPLTKSGGFSIRARLFSKDGEPLDGITWGFFCDWKQRIAVTEYDLLGVKEKSVPDLRSLPEEQVLVRYKTPFLRGPMRDIRAIGHHQLANFTAPESGEYTMKLEMTIGLGTVYFDLNQNGKWEEDEKIISDVHDGFAEFTLPTKLVKGEKYLLRVDHQTDTRHPLCKVSYKITDVRDYVEISNDLTLPE